MTSDVACTCALRRGQREYPARRDCRAPDARLHLHPAVAGSDVRAFLRELVRWCGERQYRLEEARDAEDAAYRRGWNGAIAHVAEHAQEHEAVTP